MEIWNPDTHGDARVPWAMLSNHGKVGRLFQKRMRWKLGPISLWPSGHGTPSAGIRGANSRHSQLEL